MAKGDYPTGALVEIMRYYKDNGGNSDLYEAAKLELKNMLLKLIKLEADNRGEEIETGICKELRNDL